MNVEIISTFDEIPISNNTLVLCDIDDTILYFSQIDKKWWKTNIELYSLIHDPITAKNLTLGIWMTHIGENKAMHTDKTGFENLLNRLAASNSKIVFITARQTELERITEQHFNDLNIDNSKYDIKHIGNCSKGLYVEKNIPLEKYNNVIFIDDLNENLENMYDIFGDKIKLYKFDRYQHI